MRGLERPRVNQSGELLPPHWLGPEIELSIEEQTRMKVASQNRTRASTKPKPLDRSGGGGQGEGGPREDGPSVWLQGLQAAFRAC
jgi:hypothetical protein